MNYFRKICDEKNKKVINNIVPKKQYNNMTNEEKKLFKIANCSNKKIKYPFCKNKACYHCQGYSAWDAHQTIKKQMLEYITIFCPDNFYTLRLSYLEISINSDFELLENAINKFFGIINDVVKFINNKQKKLLIIDYQTHFNIHYQNNKLVINPHVHFIFYAFSTQTPIVLHEVIAKYKNLIFKSVVKNKGLKNCTLPINYSYYDKVQNLRNSILYTHNHIINYDEIQTNSTYTRAFWTKYAIAMDKILAYKHVKYVNKAIINNFIKLQRIEKNCVEHNRSIKLYSIKSMLIAQIPINSKIPIPLLDIFENFNS